MRQELEDKLFDDFPLLYEKCGMDCMGFGFECGDGWYQLIRDLSEALYPLIREGRVENECYCYATQVKEKYGTMRFYMSLSTSLMDEIIEEYEERSSRVCEECGAPGSIDYNKFWLEALCPKHRGK